MVVGGGVRCVTRVFIYERRKFGKIKRGKLNSFGYHPEHRSKNI